MQEPLLFNYSLAENILYGRLDASNEQILRASETANALGFIQDNALSKAFDDNPISLCEALQNGDYKDKAIAQMGREKYESAIKTL